MLYPDMEVLEKDLGHARGGKKMDNSFTRLRAKDGRGVEATNSIRFFKTGDSSEYVIIAKELETKRTLKEFEETVAKQQGEIKKLEGTGELKSQFIYNISHELKTPLTNIIGFSKLLCSGDFGNLNEDQTEPHNHDNRRGQQADGDDNPGARRGEARLEQDEARAHGGRHEGHRREPEHKGAGGVGEEQGAGLHLEAAARSCPVIADYGRIIQVFVNLIGNSIKFTEKGSITVEIRTRMTKKGKPTAVECSVIDTGIGVSEEGQAQAVQGVLRRGEGEDQHKAGELGDRPRALDNQEDNRAARRQDRIRAEGGRGQQVLVHHPRKGQGQETLISQRSAHHSGAGVVHRLELGVRAREVAVGKAPEYATVTVGFHDR